MAEIVVVGGGIAGLCGAMLLARDGHQVTVLERDPASPGSPKVAWTGWNRRGVNQFRLPHAFLPRFRQLLGDELPDAVTALEAEGALRTNRMDVLPPEVTGGWRPGDERFEQLTGRRAMVEATLASMAAREPGVHIRRGVTVRGLIVDPTQDRAVPHVVGVVTDGGESIGADLVVDAGGRRSQLSDWLHDVGARRPPERRADTGFVYYARHFSSSDGAMPPMFGPPVQAYDSVSLATLAADNGYWSVVLFASAADSMLRSARHVEVWERVIRSYPLISHWIDAEPAAADIEIMAKIEDRVRQFSIDGTPLATGVVAVGDAAACTSPSLGRGASIALLHVTCLRDVLRKIGVDDEVELMRTWQEVTDAVVAPLVTDTLTADRHRLAQISAQIAGASYETDDPGWQFAESLSAAARHDPDLLRAAVDVGSLLARGVDVAHRPGIIDKVRDIGPVDPLPGPDRSALVRIVEAAAP